METIYLMNTHTGSVDTKEGWIMEWRLKRDEDISLEKWLESLVEVKKVNGNWEEIND